MPSLHQLRLVLVASADEHAELIELLEAAVPGASVRPLASLELVLGMRLEDWLNVDCTVVDAAIVTAPRIAELRRLGVTTPLVAIHAPEQSATELHDAGAADCIDRQRLTADRLRRRIRHGLRLARAEARARAAAAELSSERSLLSAVLARMPAGLLVVSADRQHVIANAQVQDMFQATLGGTPPPTARTPEGEPLTLEQWPVYRALEYGEMTEGVEILVAGERGTFILHASAAPLITDSGEISAAVMSVHDVTAERRALEAAEREARTRTDLLSIVSHDLRGPLNSIAIAAEEVADESLTAEERAHYAATITRGVGRANRLIGDLLDVDRIEAGRLEIKPVPTRLRMLLQQAVVDAEVTAERRGVGLVLREPPELPPVAVEGERIRQVLQNLIDNAMTHTRRGGAVTIAAEAIAGAVRVTVSDTGRGIPADRLPHLFDRFYQVRQEKRGHAGLGLAIARGIVRAHGGEIGVHSVVGEGATFWFTVPIADS